LSITIEGLPVEVVARRYERLQEIESQTAALEEERELLKAIVRTIDAGESLEPEQSVAAAVSEALDEGLENLPENVPPAKDEAEAPRRPIDWPPQKLRTLIAKVPDTAPAASIERIHAGVNGRRNHACPLGRVKAALLAGVAEGQFERRDGRAGDVYCLAG